jgi:uncharacterized protein (TIGR03000 family)
MKRYGFVLAAALFLHAANAQAGLFDQGIGSAMIYGPYTGGHAYPYNTAYGYGFYFSPADTWVRDRFGYPGGVYPYRPNDWPIYYRVFPKPVAPYVSVPGPDGMPVLETTATPDMFPQDGPVIVAPGTTATLRPAPTASSPPLTLAPAPVLEAAPAQRPALVRIHVPAAGAEVWIGKAKMTETGTDRVYQSAPLPQGKMQVYSVRAKWKTETGREVEQFRVVGVRAGETAKLTFSAQP